MSEELKIAGRTRKEWFDHACRDDCFDSMVPSDLRQLVNALEERVWNTNMDEAPRDGSRIITAKIISGQILCPEINEWNDPTKTGLGSLGWWKSTALTEPTAWMHIPTPPHQKGELKDGRSK